MKVYYKIKNVEYETIHGIDLNSLAISSLVEVMEKNKYRIMWALRSIENDINYEGGIIIINEKGQIETKQFTQETTGRIRELLNAEYSRG